jgi:hypothetical protein
MNRRLVPSAQRSVAHDGEIIVERASEVSLRGHAWAKNGAVTVRSSDDRQKYPDWQTTAARNRSTNADRDGASSTWESNVQAAMGITMPALKNPRHEAFAQALARG